MTRRARIIGLLVTAGALLTAAACDPTEDELTERNNNYTVAGPIDRIEVEGDATHVDLVAADGETVRVDRTDRYESSPPTVDHEVAGETLTLNSDCDTSVLERCRVEYRLEVPAATAITLRTTSGDVAIQGVTGEIDARTETGDVELSDLRSGTVTVTTTTGDVEARLAQPAEEIVADTETGDVDLVLPDFPYRVEVGSRTGDKDVAVDESSGADHEIRVSSKTGDLRVEASQP